MRVVFKKLSAFNFMSFEKLDFNFEDNNGLILITGKNNDIPGSKNGCGKSILFSALCYGLFGTLPTKIKNDYIRNRYTGEKEVFVSVLFDVENKHYRIITGLDKKSHGYCELYSINGDEETNITKSTMDETYKFVSSEILNFDITLFLRTVLLTTDNQYNFFRLKKQDKKEFIEKLFDISLFGDMYDAIHKDILSYDREILGIHNRLVVLENNQDGYTKQIEEYDRRKQDRLDKLNNELKSKRGLKSEIEQKSVNTNEKQKKLLTEKLNEYRTNGDKLRNVLDKINSKYHSLSTSIKVIEQKINIDKNQILKHAELYKKLCKTCQPIFANHYNFGKLKDEIHELKTKLDEEMSKIKKLDVFKDEYNKKLDENQNLTNEIQGKIEDIDREYQEVKRQIVRVDTEINNIISEIKRVSSEENPYSKMADSNNKELNDTKTKLDGLSDNYRHLKFAENIVSQDTIKKFVIKDLVGILNKKIQFYFNRLGADYSCVFDEDMEYEFKTKNGKCDYDSFSSGERMRLNIATSFAFRDFMSTRSNISSNVLILDEYMDSNIDTVAIDGILGILKEYNRNYKQNIYIISHRLEVQSMVELDGVIQIEKTNGISKVNLVS